MALEWLTNDPEIAAALRAADEAYAKARDKAKGLPLAEKVAAYRAADAARELTYSAVIPSQ